MIWSHLLSSRRIGQQKPSNEPSRSAFEQDYDRIIFSHPFRRLQDKTQVHPLPEHDFIHTRLTHSLEVSSVGRSLGRLVGDVIIQRHPELGAAYSMFDFGAIVAAASAAHDVGNPPFGHAGEESISDFFREDEGQRFHSSVSEEQWADLIRFEGNAQGFRILNRSEHGLRLTAATLGAFTKYPCPASWKNRDPGRKSQKKFGFFQSETERFEQVASELQLTPIAPGVWLRHPLAFLVEAADDICYSIIDLEDGCRLGLVSLPETIELLAPILGDRLNRERLSGIRSLNEKLGILRALAINRLIEASGKVFLDHEADITEGRFDQALTDLCEFNAALKQISKVSVQRIYRAPSVIEIEAAGHEVLPGLLREFVKAGEFLLSGKGSRKLSNLSMLLPEESRAEIEGTNPYIMLRTVIDFVSGLTDKHAITLYRKIKGYSG